MAKKIKLDLSQFKASGVYTLEFDASENVILTSQTIRLVVGFSNKGPFNTPVYIPDLKTALAVFGDTDRTLENQGSYFHRSIQACLTTGPIFALNLLKLNNDESSSTADLVGYRSFSVDTEELNGSVTDKLYASFYNKERFWFADPDYFLATLSVADSGKLFNLVNLGKETMSVITRKATDATKPILGYDIFAIDWYGAEKVPSYLHPYDYMSDYFVDVIAISGDWSDYQTLSLDPKWSTYFTPNGFIKSQIDNFLADPDVNIITLTQGSILPDFVDLEGNNQYIQTLINNSTVTTGLFCAIDEKGIEDICNNTSRIDLVGHHLIDELTADKDLDTPRLSFLSYDQALLADYLYTRNEVGVTGTGAPGGTAIGFEVGTLYAATGSKGINYNYFDAYSAGNKDGGFHYLETAATGAFVLTSTEKTELKSFLAVNSNADQKFIIGKVTGLTGSDAVIDQFTDNSLVKLKVIGVKEVSGELRITFSHPLDKTAYANMGITVAPDYLIDSYNTGLTGSNPTFTADGYQFGKADLLTIDSVTTPSGVTGPGAINGVAQTLVGYGMSEFYLDVDAEEIQDGDIIWAADDGSSVQYLTFETNFDRDQFGYVDARAYSNISRDDGPPSTQSDITTWGASYASDNAGASVGANKIDIISADGSINEFVDVIAKIDSTSFTMSSIPTAAISVGDLIVSTDKDICVDTSQNQQSRLTKVTSVAATATTGVVLVTTARPILYYSGTPLRVQKFQSVDEFTKSYQMTYLRGFTMNSTHRPNGSDSRIGELLDVLYDTNIASTLATKNVISFRYIVDTFSGQILPNSKYQLAKLAKDRQKALALINAPSITQFRESTDPRFTDEPTSVDPFPSLNTSYIAAGGNLSLNPSYTFSLPTEDQGAKFCGYFIPYLVVRENNRNVKVPPAAFLSNNFVRKFSNGEPYAIIGGKKRGVISGPNLNGVEYDFSDADRANLEPVGLNPIIKIGNLGPVVFGNNTAYQQVNSAFNLIHVRDILISLENDTEEILSNYLFDFNEDSIRLEIKTLVDNYLDGVRAGGGIYTYQTTMDASNNTNAIIDMNMGIIDIVIEPARGIQKFINRITVTKTGGIASGGFISFA
jgi:hypothetical protein